MRSDRQLLQDILEAIDEIAANLPTERATFDQDRRLQSHILRYLLIVGEATGRLSSDIHRQAREIPWRKIKGMRNVLVHDYFDVNWDTVFAVATVEVPALRPTIALLLSTAPQDPT